MRLNPDNIPKEDLLDRKEFAEQIATSLLKTTESETEGFVTSLTGKWGSGKTSLLHYLKEALRLKCQQKNISYIIIEFNPWTFADAENIKKAFLKEFAYQLGGNKKTFWKRIVSFFSKKLEYLDTVNPIAGKLGKEIGSAIQNYIDSGSSMTIKKQIDKLLIKSNKKVFVILDDIDRLYPKQIFEILQILKLTCNFKNTYYIAAYDREAVEASIETQFKSYGKKYLDKIVQADFLIPEAPDEKIESIFFSKLDALCKEYEIPYSTSSLSYIWLHKGFRKYFPTLRDVYRYCNSLQFSLPVIPNDIDITDFLVLEAIRLYDFEAYQKIQSDYYLSYYSIRSNKLGSSEHIEEFNNPITRKLIEHLIPDAVGSFSGNKEKRFFDNKYFERYFTLKVSSKDITELEFKKFMLPDSNKGEILKDVLKLNRIDNLLIRLSDKEIFDQHKNWDFTLIEQLYSFFSANAMLLIDKARRLTDSIINLLSANSLVKDIYFNKFIDLLISGREMSYSKLYFLHFMILSKYHDSGFAAKAEDFKEFYLDRYSKLESFYLRFLEDWKDYFIEEKIKEPLSYYTTIFIYDYARYLPTRYRDKLDKMLGNEENFIFFLKNVLSVSSENEAHLLDVKAMNFYLPDNYKTTFLKKMKDADITKFTNDQKQWREFYLDHINDVLEKIKTFTFFNQSIINGFPDKDDHYYDDVLNLRMNNYEIIFRASIPMGHWRFGIKFSIDNTFPPRELRHGSGYPIFHLEQNSDTNKLLKYSYYGEGGHQELGEPTSISSYEGENLTIKVFTLKEKTIVDVLDITKKSILKSPINVNGYKYFKVLAWADSENAFKFDAEILELN